MKRRIASAAIVLVAVLCWACHDPSPLPSPSSPSVQQQPNVPTPQATPTHTLTMTASPSCTALPAPAMKRTYPVQVVEKDGAITVLVVNSYDTTIGWANEPGFTGTRVGNTVHFDLVNDLLAPYSIIESVPGIGDMGYVGTATGTIDNGKVLAVFDGRYERGYGMTAMPLCQASDHLIEITPRDN